jgi:DNA-binding FrmR family transcriptional regulator
MHASKDTKQSILHRLKITRGHLDKVISMVENNEYCINVLHQSQAVQSALKQTDGVILKSHLENCVVINIKSGDSEKTIEEIMKVFEKGSK